MRHARNDVLFREIVLPHLADALSLARWLTNSAHDAEDVVQEASIRAFAAIEKVHTENGRAWLLAIVRNTAFTWLARNRPKALVVTDNESIFESAATNLGESVATPEAEVIAKAETELLQVGITALAAPFRETLVLREINGLTYREISEITNVPIGTVMSRLARAREQLISHIGVAHGKE